MTRTASDWDFPACVRRVIVHHSASAFDTNDGEDLRAEHVRSRGWKDVGYHYVVHAHGVSLGRPVWMQGAHDAGQNADSIGVVLVGDWRPHKDGDPWMKAADAWMQLLHLCADLLDSLDLPTTALEGHRENEPPATATLCPGFSPVDLRDAVRRERMRRRRDAPDLYPYTAQE